jgi:hypothetical protein
LHKILSPPPHTAGKIVLDNLLTISTSPPLLNWLNCSPLFIDQGNRQPEGKKERKIGR